MKFPLVVGLQKVLYKLLIFMIPSVSKKILLLQIKSFVGRLFFALKELVEVFVLDKVSYFWTNGNIPFQFCLTLSREIFS